jgi:hypothetical protein
VLPVGPDETGTYPNGYRFPPKPTWQQSTLIGLKAFGRYTMTPFGFLVTLYCLNIVAWGAMIFFLLLNAAPAMCNPSCTDPNSARQLWIERNAQTLNGLFCVTGFGLIPWRFRDFYYLVKWRVFRSHDALRTLAGVHNYWFRLPGSDQLPENLGPPPRYSRSKKKTERHNEIACHYTEEQLQELQANPAVPLPPTSMPRAPLTGVRATPTKTWLMDFLVWMYMFNTILQGGLAGLMWGMNRHVRPVWGVAFTITLGCVTGAVAGWTTYKQGRRVKKTEGFPVEEPEEDSQEQLEKGSRMLGSDSDVTERH